MRRLSVILSLLPFFIAQNAHYLSYLHCRLVNLAHPVSQHCDCEKALASLVEESPSSLPIQPVSLVQAHLDVYFDIATSYLVKNIFPIFRSTKHACLSVQVQTGHVQLPWHPPAISF